MDISTAPAGPLENGPETTEAHENAVHRPTTTHATWGAGSPRLIITHDGLHHTFLLTDDHVRIGTAQDCELRLGGLAPVHAEIDHDEHDEYVLVLHGPADTSHNQTPIATVNAEGEVLRSGAQIIMGSWRLVFERDEFADHGRPYGGRAGGEGAHQRRQPTRPDYTGQRPAAE
ncbi:MAG TPA: FHA domain-containing protein, partial [Microbacterium sp.]|nr:FHA domain-containing protein [Microbacterium sp.]